jgi:hypothetical protein
MTKKSKAAKGKESEKPPPSSTASIEDKDKMSNVEGKEKDHKQPMEDTKDNQQVDKKKVKKNSKNVAAAANPVKEFLATLSNSQLAAQHAHFLYFLRNIAVIVVIVVLRLLVLSPAWWLVYYRAKMLWLECVMGGHSRGFSLQAN